MKHFCNNNNVLSINFNKDIKYLLSDNFKCYLYINLTSNDNRKLRTYRKF